jgi:hypothetical protein
VPVNSTIFIFIPTTTALPTAALPPVVPCPSPPRRRPVVASSDWCPSVSPQLSQSWLTNLLPPLPLSSFVSVAAPPHHRRCSSKLAVGALAIIGENCAFSSAFIGPFIVPSSSGHFECHYS